MGTPEGWTIATVDDVCEFVGRGQAPAYAEHPTGIYAVSQKCVRNGRVTPDAARPHDTSKPVKASAILRSGDVCVNSTGTGTAGRVGLWSDRQDATYFVDTHVTIARGRRGLVEPKFLSEWLASPDAQRRMADECFSGSTNQIELNRSAFGALRILVPPLPEQRKIAAILSSVDETIEKTEAVIDQLQVVKKAMMEELLTRGMPGRHTRFKQTEIGEIPEGWEVLPLSELLQRIEAGWSPQCEPRPPKAGEWGVLKVSAVSSGSFLPSESKALPSALGPRPDLEVRAGDVLLARASGVLDLVGRTVHVFDAPRRLLLSDKIMRLVPGPDLDGLFLHYSMQMQTARAQVLELCGGSHMRNLAQSALMRVQVATPPLAEQRELVTALRSIEALTDRETDVLASLRNNKTALSATLLSGDLRVTPDEAPP